MKINKKTKTSLKLIIPPVLLTPVSVFLKLIIPPVLFSTIFGKPKYGFTGNYKTWKEAKKNSIGYDSLVILEKVKNSLLRVKNGEAVYERDSVIFDTIQYSWPLLTSLLWIASQNNNKLNIIDFGGSLGSSYYQNKKFLSHIDNLTWNIVEQEKFVDCGKQFFQDSTLKFFYTIEESLAHNISDTFLALGVIQYLEDPYSFVQKIIDYKFKYIVFDRTMFINNMDTDRITVQKVFPSIYNASYPAWFLNEKKFLELFEEKYILMESFISLGGEKQLDKDTKAIEKGFIFKLK